MGIGDMARKAKHALDSEKGEQVSDRLLDRGADLADRVTGGRHAATVARGRDAVNERVGTEGAEPRSKGAEPGVDGVNAVGTAGGSGRTPGTTAAGATRPGPDPEDT